MRCFRLLFICSALFMLLGCSVPLVPEASLPSPTRQSQSEADLVMRLRINWDILASSTTDAQTRAQALRDYNADLLVLVQRMRYDALHSRQLPAYAEFEMQHEHNPHLRRYLGLHEDVIPAADVPLDALKERYTLPGIGVPLVGIIPAAKVPTGTDELFTIASRGTVSSMTAVLTFPKDGGKPQFQAIPRVHHDSLVVGKHEYPLAADWSALLEVYWNLTRVKDDRWLGLLQPQELRNTTGLSSIQPYNPNKIPVILTHGLMSSASTFDNMVNRLYADPVIRSNYQFWYFNYPTGLAWTISAREYREALHKLRQRVDPHHSNPNWDKMVVVGHSMGGLITHYSQCEEPWNILRASDIPQDKLEPFLHAKYIDTPLPDPALEPLRRDYFFRPVQAGLVIYLATPHRGAPVAKYRLVTFLAKLVSLPQTLLKEAYNLATLQEDMFLLNPQDAYLWFTSVNQLKPDSYSISGLQQLKVRKAPTHSIIGDRGRGDTPQSSDGVVPYWSSHINRGTETIVPCDHSVQDCMESAVDMKRVLDEYARKNPAVTHVVPQKLRARFHRREPLNHHGAAAKK